MRTDDIYIIDGYNLIHFSDKYKKLLGKDFKRVKGLFVQQLSSYFSGKKSSVTLVFDGYSSSELNVLSTPQVKVVFSFPFKNADLKIKSLIDLSKNKALTTVVSSDKEILDYGKVSRCKTLNAKEFFKKIESRSIDYENKIKSKNLTRLEIEAWLEIFDKNNKGIT